MKPKYLPLSNEQAKKAWAKVRVVLARHCPEFDTNNFGNPRKCLVKYFEVMGWGKPYGSNRALLYYVHMGGVVKPRSEKPRARIYGQRNQSNLLKL